MGSSLFPETAHHPVGQLLSQVCFYTELKLNFPFLLVTFTHCLSSCFWREKKSIVLLVKGLNSKDINLFPFNSPPLGEIGSSFNSSSYDHLSTPVHNRYFWMYLEFLGIEFCTQQGSLQSRHPHPLPCSTHSYTKHSSVLYRFLNVLSSPYPLR